MFFNSTLENGIVKITGPDRAIVSAAETSYYTSVDFHSNSTKQTDDMTSQVIMDALDYYGTSKVNIIRHEPLTLLVAAPINIHADLVSVPQNHLWPYCSFVGRNVTRETSTYSKSGGWKIGQYTPKILVWGLRINYDKGVPHVAGLYYGTGADSEPVAYYSEKSLSAGLIEFFAIANDCDVVITNSRLNEKLAILYNMINDLRVSVNLPVTLFTSVERILASHVPGLNWNYTRIVEHWANRSFGNGGASGKAGVDRGLKYPDHWETDFYVSTGTPTYAELVSEYENVVAAILHTTLPSIAERMACAIDINVDLRCALDPTEYNAAYHVLRGGQKCKNQSRYYIEELYLAMQNSPYAALHLMTAKSSSSYEEIRPYYVYDAVAFVNANNCTFRTTMSYCEYQVRSGNLETLLASNNSIIAMYDYNIVTSVALPNIIPLFVFVGMLVSQRGFFGIDSNGNSYGFGPLGLEGARNPAIKITLTTRMRSNEQSPIFATPSETAYNITIYPAEREQYIQYLTADEAKAFEQKGIPIPVKLWRNPPSTSVKFRYSRQYNEKDHNRYLGDFLPRLK
jgi:hypothetical protein